jgi:hypothetical protein
LINFRVGTGKRHDPTKGNKNPPPDAYDIKEWETGFKFSLAKKLNYEPKKP